MIEMLDYIRKRMPCTHIYWKEICIVYWILLCIYFIRVPEYHFLLADMKQANKTKIRGKKQIRTHQVQMGFSFCMTMWQGWNLCGTKSRFFEKKEKKTFIARGGRREAEWFHLTLKLLVEMLFHFSGAICQYLLNGFPEAHRLLLSLSDTKEKRQKIKRIKVNKWKEKSLEMNKVKPLAHITIHSEKIFWAWIFWQANFNVTFLLHQTFELFEILSFILNLNIVWSTANSSDLTSFVIYFCIHFSECFAFTKWKTHKKFIYASQTTMPGSSVWKSKYVSKSFCFPET